jgi:BirA family transcriptional regulator, biotin operon repressor / biotin---[acetyl-CoA-carboxylase] ligase
VVTNTGAGDVGRWSDLERPPLRYTALARALCSGSGGQWRSLDVVERTGSTNTDLVGRARAGEPEGAVLLAEHQCAGRGRLSRAWEAPARSCLAVSVLLRPGQVYNADGRALPGVDTARWPWLPLLTGMAVVDTLVGVCGLPARLKWPNDVLIPPDGVSRPGDDTTGWLKVCGVLAEAVVAPVGSAVVVGVGLNVTQTRQELPVPTAISLRLAGAATVDRDTLARAYLRALAGRYRAWREVEGDPTRGLAAAYREACATVGREVRVSLPEGEITGLVEGVDDDGRLLVVTGGQVRPLAAGDVVHVRGAGARGGR